MKKICKNCEKEFESNNKNKKFCSKDCYKQYNKTKYHQDIKFTKIPNTKCDFCGIEFYKTPSAIHKLNFCCRKHQNTYLSKRKNEINNIPNVVCNNCGKKFHKKPFHIGKLNFCDLNCKKEYFNENNRVTKKCEYCNQPYTINKYHSENYNSRFCSKECMDNWQRRYYLYTYCFNCGKDIVVDKTRQSYHKTDMYFCSNKCANEILLNKNHNPNYKGITDITHALRYYYEKNQRGLIFKRDNKKCQICGKTAEEVHHKYPLYKIIEDYINCHPEYDINKLTDRERIIVNIINDENNFFNDLTNLMCVCKKCHDEVFHKSGWRKTFDK